MQSGDAHVRHTSVFTMLLTSLSDAFVQSVAVLSCGCDPVLAVAMAVAGAVAVGGCGCGCRCGCGRGCGGNFVRPGRLPATSG